MTPLISIGRIKIEGTMFNTMVSCGGMEEPSGGASSTMVSILLVLTF